MRKFLTLLTMCLLTTAAWADTVTFDLTTGYTNGQEVSSVSNGGVTISFANGTNTNNGPKWYSTGSALRLYGSNTMTFSSSVNITSVVLTFTGTSYTLYHGTENAPSVTAGSYAEDGTTGTWTGEASSFTFTLGGGSGHARIKTIVVTTDGTGEVTVSNPSFAPAAGTYYNPINVTMTCGTDGASIYYTLDGTDPTTASTLYSEPITISATTTVKAIAVLDDKTSEVATAQYVMGIATEVANIAAYQQVADSTVVKFTNPVVVLGHNSSNLFVMDDSGYARFYGSNIGNSYQTGNIIPGGFTGTKVTYAGEPELNINAFSNFQASSGDETVEPETIQVVDVDADMFGHYVYITGASMNPRTYKISDNSGTGDYFTGMGASAADSTKTYNVWAMIGSRKPTTSVNPYNNDDPYYCLLPMKIEEVGGGTTPSDGVATIAEYLALADNSTFTFTGNAVVTYVDPNDKRYLFIKDSTGSALIFNKNNITEQFAQGDILTAGWTGKKTLYNGLYEITDYANLSASGQTQTVTPAELTTADITAANQNIYCVLRGVKIASVNGRNFTFEDGAAGYNTFNSTVTLPSDLDKTYDIEGVISVYNNAQFAPTRFLTEVTVPKVADIEALYAATEGYTYEIESDLTAIYQNGKNLYVKDESDTYALVFGTLSETFTNGDIISGAQASWTVYNDVNELIPTASTFVKSGSGSPVQPEAMAIEELGTDMIHMYVKLDNVAVVNDSTKYQTATDATGSITLFNKFNVDMPEDGNYNVVGFVSLYKGAVQFYPMEYAPVGQLPTGDLTGDKIVDVEDVNAVINIILKVKTQADYPGNADLDGSGVIDVEDMNMIINIILSH